MVSSVPSVGHLHWPGLRCFQLKPISAEEGKYGFHDTWSLIWGKVMAHNYCSEKEST